jgi:heme A synthase
MYWIIFIITWIHKTTLVIHQFVIIIIINIDATSTVRGFIAIGVTSVGQALLGITTLLTYVPMPLAVLHQIGSIIVLTSGIYLVHSMKYRTKRIIPKYVTNKPAAATASSMATSSTTAPMVGKHIP